MVLKMSFIGVKDFHRAPYSAYSTSVSSFNMCLAQQNTSFVMTNIHSSQQNYVCLDKNMFVTTKTCVSQQNHVCHNKNMCVTTKPFHKYNFVVTSILFLRQTHVCHDQTHLLLWQKYACHDKCFVATKLCLLRQTQNIFVMPLSRQTRVVKIKRLLLSQQKLYLWQFPPMIDVSVSTDQLGKRKKMKRKCLGLTNNFDISVSTNQLGKKKKMKRKRLGLTDNFDVSVSADQLGKKKKWRENVWVSPTTLMLRPSMVVIWWCWILLMPCSGYNTSTPTFAPSAQCTTHFHSPQIQCLCIIQDPFA